MILRAALVWTAILLAGFVSGAADAHERSRSSSAWSERDEGVQGRLYLQARQATLLLALPGAGADPAAAFAQRVQQGVEIRRGGAPCRLVGAPRIAALADGRLEARGFWRCQARGAVTIDIQVFSPLSANHIHFARLERLEGDRVEDVLSRGRTRFAAGEAGMARQAGLWGFLVLGAEHILAGPDHLAFVLGLVLLVSGWRRLALVTLGFTIGHSITLALAVLGWVSPPGAAVEALIGFSILFVAAETVCRDGRPARRAAMIGAAALIGLMAASVAFGGAIPIPVWLGLAVFTACYFTWLGQGGDAAAAAPVLSAGFGLAHGVGFAGILLEVEIARDALLEPLLGFNLGVETGQLIFVAAALAAAALLDRILPASWLQAGRSALLAGLAGIGAFWFVGRAFGI